MLPTGKVEGPCHVLEYPDWVEVIALTAAGNIVLVEQYRHAVRRVQLEFPAGVIDGDEPPLVAMKRELSEETGYAADDWRLIGVAPVYPALQTNRFHSYLALGARRVADQALDEGESIQVREMPWPAFLQGIETGDIDLPALQLASLHSLHAVMRRSTDPTLVALRP